MRDRSELLSWLVVIMLFLVSGMSIVVACSQMQEKKNTLPPVEINQEAEIVATPFKTFEEVEKNKWFLDLVERIRAVECANETRWKDVNDELRNEIAHRSAGDAEINCELAAIRAEIRSVNSLFNNCYDTIIEHLEEHSEELKSKSVSEKGDAVRTVDYGW